MPSIRGTRRVTVNFDPTEEQRQWRDLARDFAQGEIRPRAADLDREQKFPYDIVAEMARLGLMGLTLPEEYGGSGGDFVAYNLALEEISRADTSVGITMEAHISLGCAPLAAYGTDEQKDKFLRPCATGERLWAFGLTEEEAGTDAGGTRTTAELRDGHWVINGSKKWITNSGTDVTAGGAGGGALGGGAARGCGGGGLPGGGGGGELGPPRPGPPPPHLPPEGGGGEKGP